MHELLEKCALCLKSRQLISSHIMPQSMYKAAGGAGDPFEGDLIHVDHKKGTSFRTSRQLKQRLLCDVCDSRLSKMGENYFAKVCYQGGGVFPLRKQLFELPPDETREGRKVWMEARAAIKLSTSDIKYFALSVLWRHSICTIPGFSSSYQNALGRKYEEIVRQFLFSESAFPSSVLIFAFVDKSAEDHSFLSYPSKERGGSFFLDSYIHSFMVPGVRFRTLIGGRVKEIKKEYYDGDVVFFEWNSSGTEFIRDISSKIRASTPKGKLKKESGDFIRSIRR